MEQVIRAGPDSRIDQVVELWQQRELVLFLAWRDLKARYQQTALGAAWAVAQPLGLMVVFTLFLGRVVPRPAEGAGYGLFAYAGLVPWSYLAAAWTRGALSVVANSHLVIKVYFPRLALPLSAVLGHLADLLVSLTLLLVALPLLGFPPTTRWLALPLLVVGLVTVALAPAVLLAAVNVRFRDVSAALPLLVQLAMFASPVVYPASIVPEQWLGLYRLNPVAGLVEGFRWALLGDPFLDPQSLLIGGGIALAALFVSVDVFRRMEPTFADVV